MSVPPELDEQMSEQVALAEVIVRAAQDPVPLILLLQRATPESAPADIATMLGCTLEQAVSVLNAQMRIFTPSGLRPFVELSRQGR